VKKNIRVGKPIRITSNYLHWKIKRDEKWTVYKSEDFTVAYMWGVSGTVVEKSFSNQKVASSIPCRNILEQDTEPLIAPDVKCAISVNVKCVYILVSRFG